MAKRVSVRKRPPTSREIAQTAAELGLAKKGDEIVILDLRKFSIGCEYFVIMTGTSEPHVRALSEWIEEELAGRLHAKPWHREGFQTARWVLLDYVDCVIHIFNGEAREFYMLERLWGDAPREVVAPPAEFGTRFGVEEAGDGTGDEE